MISAIDNDDDQDKDRKHDKAILSAILSLSIISNDFDTIIYVIHRILTNTAYQVWFHIIIACKCKDIVSTFELYIEP